MSEPTQKEISIAWPGKAAITVTLTTPPEGIEPSGYGLLLGPGAGGDEKTALLTAIANEAARQGHFCARYRAKVPNLVAGTVAAQLAGGGSTKAEPVKKAAKGKTKKSTASATNVDSLSSSDSLPASFIPGLVLFSYPLHTADNTKALRDQILLDIPASVSTLFVSGLKDTMCQPSLFAKVFKDMKSSPREVIQVTDADHGLGFGSSKPAQGKKEALIAGISEWTIAFMDETISALDAKDKQKKPSAAAATSKKKADLKKVADEWTVSLTSVAA
ncbi:Testis-expressed protein 30 [Mortierella alpina]|nr:Testis-expressed protein 30 [Mortierella alpina]